MDAVAPLYRHQRQADIAQSTTSLNSDFVPIHRTKTAVLEVLLGVLGRDGVGELLALLLQPLLEPDQGRPVDVFQRHVLAKGFLQK